MKKSPAHLAAATKCLAAPRTAGNSFRKIESEPCRTAARLFFYIILKELIIPETPPSVFFPQVSVLFSQVSTLMLYLAIVSLIWAFSFGLIGSTLAGVDSYFVATLRLGCATFIFLPFLRTKDIRKSDCLRLVAYGAIQFGLMYVCYIKAFSYLPSHLVALFTVLTPVYVVLIHDARQRRFTPRYLFAALLSVLGAAIIKAKGTPSGDIWIGFALMQLAGLAFAYGQVSYRDWKRQHPKINDHNCFALLTIGGTLCAAIFSLIFTDWGMLEVSGAQWQALLYLGCVASGLGFFLWNKGAALSNPGTLAAFNNAVVPLAVLSSLFVFGEIDHTNTETLVRLVIGAGLITTAVILGQQRRSAKDGSAKNG
ncbi:MAG: EamA family transporter [Opitutae bacterium]|nr:EamA family transporter [Opitutae bacterium]